MAINDVADQYFTYETRLASFQTAQQLSKRRASNASSKAPKSMKWPHKFLSGEELAKAGFFFYPLQANPDNVVCFLCHKSLDGWEKYDNPLAEHLKHSPDCGWAIVATIEAQGGELSQEDPSTARMIEARKATFADKWPHESKKGWKCKVKQMVDAGWKYTPSLEYDDMTTCTYCDLALDGWEPSDKPLDEHFDRSPNCPFFTLINDTKQGHAGKKTRTKKDRTSKVSRLSTQSSFTVASDGPWLADLPAGAEDSILTTATTATSQGGKKMAKGKKAPAKGRKTKAKNNEAVEVSQAPEPEDDAFEVKVDLPIKTTRSKKRKSEDSNEAAETAIEIEAPPAKRRATRTRGSIAVNNSVIGPAIPANLVDADEITPTQTVVGRKTGRQSANKSRKASTASVASTAPLRAGIPDDDEIDLVLQADLDRPLTDDDETHASVAPIRKGIRSSKIAKADHEMFGTVPMVVDDAAIEAELEAMEMDSKPLPKAKGAKGKQPRKPSAKQQAAAKKAAEAEALRTAEEEASQQIAVELEHSISVQHSSPIVIPKGRKAGSRQPSRQLPTRGTRASTMSLNDSNVSMVDASQDSVTDAKDDSGDETDASMASQSTVVRGGSTRRGSTLKKGKGGKRVASRNIEEIVQKPHHTQANDNMESSAAPAPIVDELIPVATNTNAAKPRGRPAKVTAAAAPISVESKPIVSELQILVPARGTSLRKTLKTQTPTAPQPPTRLPQETTPSPSPQSSDAENHPPSSKPSAATKATPGRVTRIPLAASTPQMSPSKRNVIAGLQSAHPWTAVDLDLVFLKSPSDESGVRGGMGLLGDVVVEKVKNGELTSPEKKMTVEEWINHNAGLAEEKLKAECERMVGAFETEGGRAMLALEGLECLE